MAPTVKGTVVASQILSCCPIILKIIFLGETPFRFNGVKYPFLCAFYWILPTLTYTFDLDLDIANLCNDCSGK